MQPASELDSSKDGKLYDVFRKKFHVPSEWAKNPDMEKLTNYKYETSNAQVSFNDIAGLLRDLGYMQDNQMMVHDYLHYMLVDLLRKNGEIFVTENDIKGMGAVFKLLNNTTPDFIIKKNGAREKTLIVDVYVGNKDISEIKSKYRKLDFFADFRVVTKDNFATQLKDVLPTQHLDYLTKHLQLFLTKYQYWSSCIKMQKILFNEQENYAILDLTPDEASGFDTFQDALVSYAQGVLAQSEI